MIAEALTGRQLVLTGVTGFVGKVYLVMLLEHFPGVGKISLLIRGGSQGALRRFEAIADTSPAFRPLRERYGSRLGEFLGERLQILDADLDRDHCGLSDPQRHSLRSADLFVHCAGITDFDPDPKKALNTNTLGALQVAKLAKAAHAPMLHVSTCYVAGERDGRIEESLRVGHAPNGTLFDPQSTVDNALRAIHKPRRGDRIEVGKSLARALGWSNIYTWSKGLAEHLLASDPELQLTIVRPAIVECAHSFPFPGWNEGINTAGPLAWLISTAFRRLPAQPTHRFDIIPVDEVARGMLITTAAILHGTAPKIVQLASSTLNPLTFERTIELTGLGLRRYVRRGGGTERERRWFKHLDPVPASGGGWFGPIAIRSWIQPIRDGLSTLIEREPPTPVAEKAQSILKQLTRTQGDLDRIEDLLTLFKPFIHDYNWQFVADNIVELSNKLPPEESAIAFTLAHIDWCQYWVDVEYPGLMKWSIPILRGQTVQADLPSVPPLQITAAARVASK